MIQLVGEELYVQFRFAEVVVMSAVEAPLTPEQLVGAVKFIDEVYPDESVFSALQYVCTCTS